MLLPEPFRTQALLNAKSTELAVLKSSLAGSLERAFDWHDSPQRHEYWKRLCDIAHTHKDFHLWTEVEQLRLICHSMAESLAKPKPEPKPKPKPVKPPNWWKQFKAGDLIDVVGIRVDAIHDDCPKSKLRVKDGTTTGGTDLYFDDTHIRPHKADLTPNRTKKPKKP